MNGWIENNLSKLKSVFEGKRNQSLLLKHQDVFTLLCYTCTGSAVLYNLVFHWEEFFVVK